MRFGPRRKVGSALPAGVLWQADFSAATAGAFAGLGAMGLALSRASVATVRTSAQALASGIPVNTARVRYDGSRRGLLVEESRTNLLLQSVDLANAAWTHDGTVNAGYGTGPNGSESVARVQAGTGVVGAYQYFSCASGYYILSEWIKSAGGGFDYWQADVRYNNGADYQEIGNLTPIAWTRYSLGPIAHVTGNLIACEANDGRDGTGHGGIAAGPRDSLVCRAQLEMGTFPTSDIDTGATATSRAADYLWHTNFGSLVSNGRLSIYLCLYPICAGSEMGSGIVQLFNNDASGCYANIDGPTRQIFMGTGGTSTNYGALPTWARGDKLELYIALGGGSVPSAVKARVNGGTVTTLTTGTVHGAISADTPNLDLLCHATYARQFSAAVEKIVAYDNTTLPGSWAA